MDCIGIRVQKRFVGGEDEEQSGVLFSQEENLCAPYKYIKVKELYNNLTA